ncbi:MAG: hypothetical protein JXR16_04700 [Bermanella sp.]
MKLPHEPTINVQSTSPTQPPPKGAQVSRSGSPTSTTNPSIQALINTWAKVESSQTLPASQNQQVLRQLALLNGQTPQSSQNQVVGGGISEKLNLSNIAQTLTKQAALPDNLKLVLIKLLSVQGPINILSNRPIATNTHVLLQQTPEGKLSIQSAQTPTPLNQFRSQFVAQNFILKPIALIDNNQITNKEIPLKFPFTTLPTTTLQSHVPLAPTTLKQALMDSGQNFEARLAQLLQSVPQATQGKAQIAATSTVNTNATQENQSNTHTNMQSKMAEVEKNIQKWVSLFQQKISSSTANNAQANTQVPSNASSQSTSVVQQPSLSSIKNADNLKSVLSQTPTSTRSHDSLNNDHKNWLIQNQHQLLEQLSKQLLQRKDSFIPNWPATAFQGANAGASIKTFQDLSQWLTMLMIPKTNTDSQAESIWPKSLGVQPQLQQTLLALSNSLNQNDNESLLLRQLLGINQSLSKLTHDQIQNRFFNTQDNTQFQLSLPYVHQNQIQWCDFECKQHTSTPSQNETVQGWHLILRFAQQTSHAFAVESQLKQEQLAVTLWASEAEQLKKLHQHIPLIKSKLEQAGFKIDSVTSKHGEPKPLHQPIQQSLIDVHT